MVGKKTEMSEIAESMARPKSMNIHLAIKVSNLIGVVFERFSCIRIEKD